MTRKKEGGGGIYSITCSSNNKTYVGKTKNFKERWLCHISNLNRNKHCNQSLQNAWNKYGKEDFVFKILQEFDVNEGNVDELCDLEKGYISSLGTKYPNGFNLTDGGEGTLGFKVSDETKKKISESTKGEKHSNYGKTFSPEYREKIRLGSLGKVLSAETKAKIGNSIRGRTLSQEHKNKISESHLGSKSVNFGKILPDEVKEKMSQSQMGNKNPRFGKKLQNSSSKYFGVFSNGLKKYPAWLVYVIHNKQRIYVGRFKLEIDAAKAYDKHIIENNIDKPINFPEDYRTDD